MNLSTLRLAVPVALGLLTGAFVASVGDDSNPGHYSGQEARQYTVEVLQAMVVGAEWYAPVDTYSAYLPNQKYSFDGRAPEQTSGPLVVGRITRVEDGAGYRVAGRDGASGTLTDFDAPDATWRVVDVTVSVDKWIGGAGQDEVRVGVRLTADADPDSFKNGLLGARIAAPLSRRGFFQHDAGLWRIERNDTLLGFVDGDGNIDLPLLLDAQERVASGVDSLADVIEEATKEREVIRVSTAGGLPRAG